MTTDNAVVVTMLQAILLKVDAIKEQVAVQSGFIELDADIAGWINQFGGHMNVPLASYDHLDLDKRLGSVISWLQQYPRLYATLYMLDKMGSGFIFGDPTHTISYNIAIRAKAGNALCQELCGLLNLLSPNHCAWALENEGLCKIALGL